MTQISNKTHYTNQHYLRIDHDLEDYLQNVSIQKYQAQKLYYGIMLNASKDQSIASNYMTLSNCKTWEDFSVIYQQVRGLNDQ